MEASLRLLVKRSKFSALLFDFVGGLLGFGFLISVAIWFRSCGCVLCFEALAVDFGMVSVFFGF